MVEIVVATIMRASGDTGVQTHFRTFVRWLESKGKLATIVTPYNVPPPLVYPIFAVRRIIDRLNGPASVWWYRYWHTAFLELALRRRLADGNGCMIYAQCPLSAAAALRARQNANQQVVLVVHFNVSQANEWAGKGTIASEGAYAASIRKFEALTLPQLDGLVFVSEFMRTELMKSIPQIAGIPFVVAPNFVPDPGQPPATQTTDSDLLTVGTLERRKNQAYALEIIAAAKRRGKVLTLTIAGDGPDRAMLEAMAATLGIEEDVQFLGFVRNAAQLFSRHRACLHTACIENLPLTLVEALSHGIPIFSPAVGGVPEIFSDGFEGRYLPLDDPDLAATILLEWFENDGLQLKKAKEKARTTFLEKFESEVAAKRLYDFLMAIG